MPGRRTQQRYRRRYHEKTLALARMVRARAAEAVVATRVENAIGFAQLLRGALPVNAATDRYLREFGLPANVAQMVLQRVQARVAGDGLTAQYDDLPPRQAEPAGPSARGPDPTPAPAPDRVPAFPNPAAKILTR